MATAGEPPFGSHPSELELIRRYLRPWVVSGELDCSWIHQTDIYAADPAVLTASFLAATASEGEGEQAWYFICRIRNKKGSKTRKHRAAASGGGSWFSDRAAKPVADGSVHVGKKQRFCFTLKDEEGRHLRSRWLMLELRLAGDEQDEEPWALCKVYPSPRENPAAKARAMAAANARARAMAAADSRPRAEALPSAVPPPEHGAPSPSEEGVPTTPLDKGTPGAHAEDAGSAAPPTVCGTSSPEDAGSAAPTAHGMPATKAQEAAGAARPAVPSAWSPRSIRDAAGGAPAAPPVGGTSSQAVQSSSTPRADGTKEWVLIQIGVHGPQLSSPDSISVNKIFRVQRLQEEDDTVVAPLAGLKRKALEVCSGFLMLDGAHATKKPALCPSCSSDQL
ncbi:hypothetical protein QYE76_034551 [Lolium multiflorum]|uniref:NAC domain-containing protein n=1 Tax=Lolium multiflorum TaxID=4521 RepID=A0AAD8VNF1_LOLMU|nr:hypothetical protein QYE76_034551 [Lolium multiflorum]